VDRVPKKLEREDAKKRVTTCRTPPTALKPLRFKNDSSTFKKGGRTQAKKKRVKPKEDVPPFTRDKSARRG